MNRKFIIWFFVLFFIIFFTSQSSAVLVSSYTNADGSFHLDPLSGNDFEQIFISSDAISEIEWVFFWETGMNPGDKINAYIAYDHLTGSEYLHIEAGFDDVLQYYDPAVFSSAGDIYWTPLEYTIPNIPTGSKPFPDSWWLAAVPGLDPLTITTGYFFVDDLEVTPIPAPATIFLLISGLLVLIGFKKFKIARNKI